MTAQPSVYGLLASLEPKRRLEDFLIRTEPYDVIGVGGVMADVKQERGTQPADRVGRVLQDALEGVRQLPVPERWVDLLNRLNAEEDQLKRKQRTH